VLGLLPDAVQITTIFSGSVASTATQTAAMQALLQFWASAATAPIKLRHGLAPA
jgi:molybdate transport system substrate-binding protein